MGLLEGQAQATSGLNEVCNFVWGKKCFPMKCPCMQAPTNLPMNKSLFEGDIMLGDGDLEAAYGIPMASKEVSQLVCSVPL